MKNSGHTVFQGKHKLLKNSECKNYIQYSVNFQGKLCFQSKRKLLKNPYFNAVNIFKANSVFQGKRKLFKILKDKKYIKYGEFRAVFSEFSGFSIRWIQRIQHSIRWI